MLAPRRRQSLIPPPGHANSPAKIPPGGRPCWRRPVGKTLSHRRATPTGRPKSRLPAAHVGAPPPAKPYPTAWPRQQAGPNPARRPPMLAPLRRQNLIPPPGHANRPARIPPAGRPCCHRPLRVGGGSDILHLRRVNLNSCKWRTEYETDSSNGPRRNFGGVCDSGFCSCRGGIGN